MTIDAEKLRALSRGCEYTVKATEAGDVSELWAVRFDVMGRPYNSRIGVTSRGVAALIAAAVNALPELLDALATAEAERLTLARGVERERVRYERGLQLEPQCNAYDLAARIVAEADAEVRRG